MDVHGGGFVTFSVQLIFSILRMRKISWTEKVTNEEVLVRADEARRILKTMRRRKHRWLGHVLRHDNLLHDIIKGKMLGKATWGRKRMELLLLHDMMEGRDYGQLKDLIWDRSRWRQDSKWKSCQKPAGNSRRLKKQSKMTRRFRSR